MHQWNYLLTRAFSVCAANCRLLTVGRILSRKGNISSHYCLRKDYGNVDVIKCDTLFCSTRALIGERDAQSGPNSSWGRWHNCKWASPGVSNLCVLLYQIYVWHNPPPSSQFMCSAIVVLLMVSKWRFFYSVAVLKEHSLWIFVAYTLLSFSYHILHDTVLC